MRPSGFGEPPEGEYRGDEPSPPFAPDPRERAAGDGPTDAGDGERGASHPSTWSRADETERTRSVPGPGWSEAPTASEPTQPLYPPGPAAGGFPSGGYPSYPHPGGVDPVARTRAGSTRVIPTAADQPWANHCRSGLR